MSLISWLTGGDDTAQAAQKEALAAQWDSLAAAPPTSPETSPKPSKGKAGPPPKKDEAPPPADEGGSSWGTWALVAGLLAVGAGVARRQRWI